jgi:hypothetical protein
MKRLALAALAAGLMLAAVPPTLPAETRSGGTAAFGSLSELRYRVLGRVRLALFGTRGSLVGSARMAVRRLPDSTELSFLLGADPRWAPNHLSQWSYVREETARDRATAFALRSLSADDAIDRGLPTAPDGQRFGASCAFVQDGGIRSLLTTIDASGMTYRMFDRVLDGVAVSPVWQERQLPRQAGIRVGLLSAMEQVIAVTAAQPAAVRAAPPLTYIYDGTLYDLSVRNAQSIGPVQFGATRFEWLTRIDFSILNRQTREVSRFSAAFVPGVTGALPVQIIFQPNFWLRVELRLDDEIDVPSDPAADGSTLARIRAVCAEATQRSGQTATGGRRGSAPRN